MFEEKKQKLNEYKKNHHQTKKIDIKNVGLFFFHSILIEKSALSFSEKHYQKQIS